MQPRERFAENLKKARKVKGVSQETLAHDAGLDRTVVGLLERQKKEPKLMTVVKLARALDIPPAQLLDGIE